MQLQSNGSWEDSAGIWNWGSSLGISTLGGLSVWSPQHGGFEFARLLRLAAQSFKSMCPVPRERVPSWTAFLCHGFRSPAESLLPHVLLKKQVIRPVLKGKIVRVHLLVEECQKGL